MAAFPLKAIESASCKYVKGPETHSSANPSLLLANCELMKSTKDVTFHADVFCTLLFFFSRFSSTFHARKLLVCDAVKGAATDGSKNSAQTHKHFKRCPIQTAKLSIVLSTCALFLCLSLEGRNS